MYIFYIVLLCILYNSHNINNDTNNNSNNNIRMLIYYYHTIFNIKTDLFIYYLFIYIFTEQAVVAEYFVTDHHREAAFATVYFTSGM